MTDKVTVIGAGLAGSEAAFQLAELGIPVELVEMRPLKQTPAHHTGYFAELVCSNSLRAASVTNAVGLLKEEMRRLHSVIMDAADHHSVPAGGALAVDRMGYAEAVTEIVKNHPLITFTEKEVTEIPEDGITIIATGPLTEGKLAEAIEASRIPIREAFQILENQGLIIRLATRRITVTELDKEQICLIYSMISEMTKKALNSLKHSGKTAQLEELLMTSGLSGEVQPAEAMCDLVENEYIKRLLRNASDSYIRFALSTGHYADKIKEEKDKMTELLENGELKKVEKSLDVYFKLLARAVNEERGMNE